MYQVIKKQVLAGASRTKRGFTLIELLVVVLIIGILAAIAVPQYQKAVWKAKLAEFYTLRDALRKNFSAYYLEHGTLVGITEDTMDISLPELTYVKFCPSWYCATTSDIFTFTDNWHSTGGKPYCTLFLNIDDIALQGTILSDNSSALESWACFKKSGVSGKNKDVCGKYFSCIPGDPNDVCHIEL